jgi:predicted MFS family arabinose efflux permease
LLASSLRLIGFTIAAEILAMTGSSAVAATLPTLIAAWHLTAAQAGWLSGAYFLGYAVAVPVLVSATDRVDARWIFAGGCVAGVAANAGMSVASGLGPAMLAWAVAGAAMAAIYMPGLRVITDRCEVHVRLRAVPYYTASFGLGISVSFLAAGFALQVAGWRAAFVAGACGCAAALVCLVIATAGFTTPRSKAGGSGGFDLRGVLRNRPALRYIFAYGGHCWELFAFRSWLVALLLFWWKRDGGADPGGVLTSWSAIVTAAGVAASILGAEAALRFGRPRLVVGVATATTGIALAIALSGIAAFVVGALALVAYSVAILGDSGAITAGVIDAAEPGLQGATLALHSLIGFVGAALGPVAVGIAIGWAGGVDAPAAWSLALIVMAAGSAIAALAVFGLARAQPAAT